MKFKRIVFISALISSFFLTNCNEDEGPKNSDPEIDDQSFTIDENSENGITVGQVIATDDDENQSLSFSIVSGNESGAFALSSSGSLTVADQSEIDYETNSSFSLLIEVVDDFKNAGSGEALITVGLIDINEAHLIEDGSFSIDEHSDNGTQIGVISLADEDETGSYSFEIVSGDSEEVFSINSQGSLTVNQFCLLDFETQAVYNLTISASDDDFSDQASIEVNLNDISLPEAGLVAFYPFNGNANDESGNDLHGTVNGATLGEDRNGCLNSAYSFDGNDYILLGDDFDYTELTISVWAKAEITIPSEVGMIFLSSDHGSKENNLWNLNMRNVDELDQLGFSLGFSVNREPIDPTLWHHVLVYVNGDSFEYYLNNELVHSGTVETHSSVDGVNVTTVGCSRKFDRFFTGLVDDIRIYNGEISANDRLLLFTELE